MRRAGKIALGICSFLLPLALGLFLGSGSIALFIPVTMNAGVAAIFVLSLFSTESVVEKIARLQEGLLRPEVKWYCRWASRYWAAVLITMTAISAWIALEGSLQSWLWFNGFLSYVLYGAVFATEYLARILYRRRIS